MKAAALYARSACPRAFAVGWIFRSHPSRSVVGGPAAARRRGVGVTNGWRCSCLYFNISSIDGASNHPILNIRLLDPMLLLSGADKADDEQAVNESPNHQLSLLSVSAVFL